MAQKRDTLLAVCKAFIPHSDDDLPERIFNEFADDPEAARLANRFLQWLEEPLINAVLSGYSQPFTEMSLAAQTTTLNSWQHSALSTRRRHFAATKRLLMQAFYGTSDKVVADPPEASTLQTDVVVVGSGPAGKRVAERLSAGGYDVVLLETCWDVPASQNQQVQLLAEHPDPPTQRDNLRFMQGSGLQKVLIERGNAVGVQTDSVVVRAKIVVAAAGGIHTPALLLRSGLGNYHIGRHLSLHPTAVVYGIYEQPPAPVDVRDNRVHLQSIPLPPELIANTLPWQSGPHHRSLMAQSHLLSGIAVTVYDEDVGRVKINRHGIPIIDYTFEDLRSLKYGLISALRLQVEANPTQLVSPLNTKATDTADELLQHIAASRSIPALFSRLQMASCRRGDNPAQGAISPTGETFEVQGLYVADGSAIPDPPEAPPLEMILDTAELVAHYIQEQEF